MGSTTYQKNFGLQYGHFLVIFKKLSKLLRQAVDKRIVTLPLRPQAGNGAKEMNDYRI